LISGRRGIRLQSIVILVIVISINLNLAIATTTAHVAFSPRFSKEAADSKV
jgi:hypothetical protein